MSEQVRTAKKTGQESTGAYRAQLARILANILLHGVTGEISVAGASYNGAMPPFQQLADAELAGLASFIRSSWSNKAGAVQPALFEHERKASPRSAPFEGGAALKALAAAPAS